MWCAQVPEYVATQKAANPRQAGTARERQPGETPPRTPPKKKKKKKAPSQEEETPPVKKPRRERGFTDKSGEIGPNGLERKVGGNDKGGKCAHIAKGEECPYATCSFSHK